MEISTKAEFLSAINDSQSLSIVLFHSSQQPQSKQMANALEMLKNEHGFNYYKICLDNRVSDIRNDWEPAKITTSPLVVLFKGEKQIGKIEGADVPNLIKMINHHLKEGNQTPENAISAETTEHGISTSIEKEALHNRLESLVNSSPVIIFMKGSKNAPFCRFSKQAVAILNSLNVDFNSFDVFTDESVREGMKEFSQWPTFPQLFVKGEFIGGVDIMNEMLETGELSKLFEEFKSPCLESRLRLLVNRAPVMVFMKGERHNPFCRFSRQLMLLLDEAGVNEFETFNILNDDEVREGLKKYSDWPTYPQVYVNGQLLGGVDIVKEILDTGGRQALLEEIQGMMAFNVNH